MLTNSKYSDKTLPKVSVRSFLRRHKIKSCQDSDSHHSNGQQPNVGGNSGCLGGGGHTVKRWHRALRDLLLLLTLTCLLVHVLARRAANRVSTPAWAEQVIPVSERVPSTLILSRTLRRGTLTLAVGVAPNLVSGTVCLTLLTAAPAGAFVMLQFYLTAHLKYIVVLGKFDNSLSFLQENPQIVDRPVFNHLNPVFFLIFPTYSSHVPCMLRIVSNNV